MSICWAKKVVKNVCLLKNAQLMCVTIVSRESTIFGKATQFEESFKLLACPTFPIANSTIHNESYTFQVVVVEVVSYWVAHIIEKVDIRWLHAVYYNTYVYVVEVAYIATISRNGNVSCRLSAAV